MRFCLNNSEMELVDNPEAKFSLEPKASKFEIREGIESVELDLISESKQRKVEGGAEMETLSEVFPAEFTKSSSTVVEGGGL